MRTESRERKRDGARFHSMAFFMRRSATVSMLVDTQSEKVVCVD